MPRKAQLFKLVPNYAGHKNILVRRNVKAEIQKEPKKNKKKTNPKKPL